MKIRLKIVDPIEVIEKSMERGDVVDIFLITGVRLKAVVKCLGSEALSISTPEGGSMTIFFSGLVSVVNNSISLE